MAHRLRLAACGAWLALAGLLAAGGCAGTPGVSYADPAKGPRDTGTFPNLNIPPKAAAPVLTPEDKSRLFSEIGAAQSGQGANAAGLGVQGSPETMQRIAKNHGTDTLKAIEDQ